MFHVKQKFEDELDGTSGASTGAGAEVDDSWKASLPDNVKDWNEVKEAKSPESFWEQMQNMRSFIGQSIRVPGEDASKEDRAAFNEKLMEKVPNLIQKPDIENDEVMQSFYNQMGRPAEVTGYKAPEISAPDGIMLQEDLPDTFKGIAHRYGLTQKQYEGVIKDYTQNTIDQAEDQLNHHRTAMKGLNDEWGMKYDSNIKKAEAIRATYFNDVVPNLDVAGADTVKAFANIAERFGKEGANQLIENTRSEPSNSVVPEEAQNRLDDILRNRDHAYWNASDPGHQRAVDKVVELTKMANPKSSRNVDDLRSNQNVVIG